MLRQTCENELSVRRVGRPLGTEKISEGKYDVLLNRAHYHINLQPMCYAGGSNERIQPSNSVNDVKQHEAMYAERGDIDDGGGANQMSNDPVEGRTQAQKAPLQPFSTRFKDGPVDKLGHAKLTKDSFERHAIKHIIKCKPPDIVAADQTRVHTPEAPLDDICCDRTR